MSLFFSGFGSLQDQKLFREDGGWEVVSAVAQYWCSRMVWSPEEQCYHIKGTSATARPVRREGVCASRGSELLQPDLDESARTLRTPALWNISQIMFASVQAQDKMLSFLPVPLYRLFSLSAACHLWNHPWMLPSRVVLQVCRGDGGRLEETKHGGFREEGLF